MMLKLAKRVLTFELNPVNNTKSKVQVIRSKKVRTIKLFKIKYKMSARKKIKQRV